MTSGMQIYQAMGGGGFTNKIVDPIDQDTLVEAEEDQVTMDTAGAEAFLLDAAGILTLAKQSAARAYLATYNQIMPGSLIPVILNAESYDVQGEFDITVVAGTADATEADKLHDTDGGFDAGMVGWAVWNLVHNTYATVTGFVDSGELDPDDDIITNGEGYRLFAARFTATVAGKYVCESGLYWDTTEVDKKYQVRLYVNGVFKSATFQQSSHAASMASSLGDGFDIAISDYIQLKVASNTVADMTLLASSPLNFLAIAKVS